MHSSKLITKQNNANYDQCQTKTTKKQKQQTTKQTHGLELSQDIKILTIKYLQYYQIQIELVVALNSLDFFRFFCKVISFSLDFFRNSLDFIRFFCKVISWSLDFFRNSLDFFRFFCNVISFSLDFYVNALDFE